MNTEEKYLTGYEVAERLRVSNPTFWRMVRDNTVPFPVIRFGLRRYIVPLSGILEWEERERSAAQKRIAANVVNQGR